MRLDDRDPPTIDLESSEWSRGKLRQTVLTPHGKIFLKHFVILLVAGLLIAIPANLIFRGYAPYWIRDLIPFEWEGLSFWQSAIALGVWLGFLFAIAAILERRQSRRG